MEPEIIEIGNDSTTAPMKLNLGSMGGSSSSSSSIPGIELLMNDKKGSMKSSSSGDDGIHVDDLANAINFCLKIEKSKLKKIFNSNLPILNVGTGDEISIKKLSKLIAKYISYDGQIEFDKVSPDGTFRKKLNSKKINSLGWFPKIKFKKGLKNLIESKLG